MSATIETCKAGEVWGTVLEMQLPLYCRQPQEHFGTKGNKRNNHD
jgi:hypothetical protein